MLANVYVFTPQKKKVLADKLVKLSTLLLMQLRDIGLPHFLYLFLTGFSFFSG